MDESGEHPNWWDRMPIAPLAVWRYSALLSFVVTVPLFGLARMWLWYKDYTAPGGVGSHLAETGLIAFVGITLAKVWELRRR